MKEEQRTKTEHAESPRREEDADMNTDGSSFTDASGPPRCGHRT